MLLTTAAGTIVAQDILDCRHGHTQLCDKIRAKL